MTSNPPQQIRPIIECFCKILSFHGFTPITPEIFRLAKFNRNEAVRISNSHVALFRQYRMLFRLFHYGVWYLKSCISILPKRISNTILINLIKHKKVLFTCAIVSTEFTLVFRWISLSNEKWFIHTWLYLRTFPLAWQYNAKGQSTITHLSWLADLSREIDWNMYGIMFE